MPRILPAATRVLAILSLAASLQAAPPPLQLKWNQLVGAVIGQHVIVDLKDKSHVNAVVTAVSESALSLRVTSNSHPSFKKGEVAIPKESVAGLRLIRMRVRGRIIATSIGAVAGTAAGGILVIRGENCGLWGPCGPPNRAEQAAGIAIWAAVPVAMYFLGKHWDRQEIPIVLLPD